MSVGLHFRKVDLHVHTPASKCFLNKDASASDIVESALAAGVDAIAITDHNTGAWIDGVKQAAADTPLTVFSGVEITVSEGFHVVALFDTTKGTADVANLLGALEMPTSEQGQPEALCKKSAHEVIDKIVEFGGLAILAHIDQPGGISHKLDGNPLRRLYNEACYQAVESTTGEVPAEFSREKGFLRVPACYQASDNPDPDDPKKHSHRGIGSKYSYFKLDTVITLEGLRQCLADQAVRIKKMGAYEEASVPHIISLHASDGFLKYPLIRFHPGLNSIIGGKGVGKSLIVEFLRFALDQPSNDAGILKDYNGKLEKRLGPFNSVEVVCQMPSGAQFKITRVLNGSHECIDMTTGEPYLGKISELFPILAYSQTEVIKITENEEAQLTLVDGFIDPRPYIGRINQISEILSQYNRALAEGYKAKYDIEGYKKDVETSLGEITEIDRALSANPEEAKLLAEFKVFEGKKGNFESQQDYLTRLISFIDGMITQLENILPPGLTTEQDNDGDLVWAQSQSVGARKDLVTALEETKKAIGAKQTSLLKRIEEWLPSYKEKETEYLSALQSAGTKKQLETQRRALDQRHKEAKEKVDACQKIIETSEGLQSTREQMLDNLAAAYLDYFSERKRMFDTLAQRSGGKLKLELKHSSNRQEFAGEIKTLLSRSGVRSADIDNLAENMMPRMFVKLVCDRNVEALAVNGKISNKTAQTIIEKLWSGESIEPVLNLEYSCYPKDVPTIQFQKEPGTYAPLGDLSVGQKCTALLIIALSEGARPVIIDQPEDALDITTVWEDVSMKLRQGKEKRQFILTTHNASVAVSSDSDMYVVVKGDSQYANVKCLGAIEHPDVKKAVIQHLEGGEEPYNLRLNKYNVPLPYLARR